MEKDACFHPFYFLFLCQLVRHKPGTDLPLTQIFADNGVHRVLAQFLRHQL